MAFEISRRHGLQRTLADLPEGVEAHLLPSGTMPPVAGDWGRYLRYRDYGWTGDRIQRAYVASAAYLKAAGL